MTDVVVAAERLQVVREVQVASLALLLADWTILFTEEVDLIWKSKWTFTKILYLLSRYSPFIDTPLNLVYYLSPNISYEKCRITYILATWFTAWGMALAELVLLVRTYAIYSRSRKVLYIIGGLWLAWVAGNIPIINIYAKSLKYGDPPTKGMPGCHVTSQSSIVFASFATLLLFEIMIVTMTSIKGYQHFKRSTSRSRLSTVLYRDGILFFFVLLIGSLGNVIVLVVAPPEFLDLLNTFTRVVHSIVCCRILLNIRDAGRQDVQGSVPQHEARRAALPGLHHRRPSSGLVFEIGTEAAAYSGTDGSRSGTGAPEESAIELAHWTTVKDDVRIA